MPHPDETISVVMPVYNAQKYLREALDSVFSQTVQANEVIVVNDGSTDNSQKIIEEYPATLINQSNSGPAVARNRGLDSATGNFIAFIDADDFWPDNKLSMHMDYFRTNPDLEVVIGALQLWKPNPQNAADFMKHGAPAHSVHLGTGVYRRSLLKKMGGLTPQYLAEDMDFYLRMRESGARIKQVMDLSLYYRLHDTSLTSDSDQVLRSTMQMLKRSIKRRARAALPPVKK